MSDIISEVEDDIINKQTTEQLNNQVDKKLIKHYKNAEHVSIIPLLKLIYLTNGIDLSNKYKLKHSLTSNNIDKFTAGELVLSNGVNNIKISLDIVDQNYDLLKSINDKNIFQTHIDTLYVKENDEELEETKDSDDDIKLKKTIVSAISFLTQACLVCFNMIKNDNKDLLEYNLTLDHNTTIYLDHMLNKRIGVVFN